MAANLPLKPLLTTSVTRFERPMPKGSDLSFLPILLLLLVAVLVLSASPDWEPLTKLFRPELKKPTVMKPDVKVWANKSTGLYYCAGAKSFGRTGVGRYMSQMEALQSGYRPVSEQYCQ